MARDDDYRDEEDLNGPDRDDPDINGVKLFIGGLVAIVLAMSGIYFFANMHAINLASNAAPPPVNAPAPEPATPPPSTMSR